MSAIAMFVGVENGPQCNGGVDRVDMGEKQCTKAEANDVRYPGADQLRRYHEMAMTERSTPASTSRSLSRDDVDRLCNQLRDQFPERPTGWDEILNSREPSIEISRDEWAERLADAEPRTEDDVPWRFTESTPDA